MNDYENEMRWVMRYVMAGNDINKLDGEEMRMLKECVDAGYLDGLSLSVAASGRIVGQITHDVYATRAGEAFLAVEETVKKQEGRDTGHTVNKRDYETLKRILEGILIAVIGGAILEWLFTR